MSRHEEMGPHPVFVVTGLPGDTVDVSICWDEIDAPGVAKVLRKIADGLDGVPPGPGQEGLVRL